MREWFIFSCVLLVVRGDDGLCSIDAPPQGGSCSGGGSDPATDASKKKVEGEVLKYAYEEKPMNDSETEIWAKRFYDKLSYTNDYDWKIHELLDDADEYIVNDPLKAIQMFEDVLAQYPDSARGYYAMTRTYQYVNTTDKSPEEVKALQTKVLDMFKTLLTWPEDKVMPTLFGSAVHQGLIMAMQLNRTEARSEILRLGFQRAEVYQNERYHELNVQELVNSQDLAQGLKAVETAMKEFPANQFFKFMRGVILKMDGRKKEANLLLRDVELNPNEVYGVAADLIGMANEFHRRSRPQMAELLYQEASKAHIFLSKQQRPYEALPDLESKPIWDLEDTQMTAYDEEFNVLKEHWQDIREEALEARKNISNWVGGYSQVEKGKMIQFPLFSWGKKRKYYCSLVPKTCAIFKNFPGVAKFPKGNVRFLVIGNQTHTHPHCGPTNARVRAHLGLQIPQELKIRITKGNYVHEAEGKVVLFEDSFEHEIWNDNETKEAIVLSFDLPHPDLTFQQSKQPFARNIRHAFETL